MILYNPTVSGSLLITGSLTTTGTLTAQTLVVQTITSSVDFVTGSAKFGSLSSNTHQFTGSVLITGSVGIGINSPSATLHTEVSSSTWVSKIINTNTSSNNAGLLIKAGVNSGNEILLAQKANGTSVFLVDASGNVGIGTTSPGEKLGVFGNILINTNNTASSGEIDKIVFGKAHTAGGGYAYSISEIRSFTSNGYAGGLNFYTGRSIGGGAYDAVFAMKINELGNVLVGTSTDNGYKLNVSGSIYSTDTVFGRNLKPEAFAGPAAGTPTSATIPPGYSSMNISSLCDNQWRPLMNNIGDVKAYFWVTLGDAASKDTANYFISMTSPAYGVSNFGNLSYQDNGWNTGGFEFTTDTSAGMYRLLVRCTSYYNSANTAYGTIYFLRME